MGVFEFASVLKQTVSISFLRSKVCADRQQNESCHALVVNFADSRR